MALNSATFFVDDYRGNHYKVHAIKDSILDSDSLWCMVYKAIGIGNNPYDYGEMEYEEDYSADFSLHIEDCLDLNDDVEVETVIQQKFNDAFWVNTWIDDTEIYVPTEEEMDKEVKEDIFQCKVKKVLADYHNLDLESVDKAVALANLASVAERMAKILEEKFG